MARTYKALPFLYEIQKKVALSDEHPCGLVWLQDNHKHKAGEPAGTFNPVTGYYYLFLYGVQYVAHRVVYYLRTGEDPGTADVLHANRMDFPRDNRKTLFLHQRKSVPPVKRPRKSKEVFGEHDYSRDQTIAQGLKLEEV